MDVDEEEHLQAKLRTKGKSQTYLIRPNVLELKQRTRRQGKCLGAAVEVLEAKKLFRTEMEQAQLPKEYNYISNDIWFHLANYIPPEDVKRYALICTQSAYSIRSRRFWLQLYRQYCQHSKDKKKWILELPAQLQMNQLIGCDVHTLRQRVIQALFYCHRPFTEILKQDYKLETLWGRYYVSCWHVQTQCVYIMSYKFKFGSNFTSKNASDDKDSASQTDQHTDEVVQDWESLAEEDSNNKLIASVGEATAVQRTPNSAQDVCDGVSLLLICCTRFIPFPADFLYLNSTSSIRLAATRELISKDMRTINLEIDLVSSRGDQSVLTWKYNQVLKWKVVPWWHPDFNKFNQCTL